MRNLPFSLFCLFLTVFLLRFPPLYFTGFQNILLTTHIISITIIFLLASYFLFKKITNKTNKTKIFSLKLENFLILIFFVTQSLSILNAVYIPIFIQRYSKIIVGMIIYFTISVFLLVADKAKRENIYKIVIYAFFSGGLIAVLLQLILVVYPNLYFGLISFFIYSNILDITKANYDINKLFDDSYLEIVIPIIVFYLLSVNLRSLSKKFFLLLLLIIIAILVLVSNFRYRLLAYLFSIFLTFSIFKINDKGVFNKIFILGLVIIFIINNTNPLIRQFSKNTAADRLTEKKEYEEYTSFAWRLQMFDKSIELAGVEIFGVGLGNMFDYLSKKEIYTLTQGKLTKLAALLAGPHNIFFQYLAETGFIGLLGFVLLLTYYLKKDTLIIKRVGNQRKKVFISMFWTLIFIVQFFPAINLTYYVLFFLLRGLIIHKT